MLRYAHSPTIFSLRYHPENTQWHVTIAVYIESSQLWGMSETEPTLSINFKLPLHSEDQYLEGQHVDSPATLGKNVEYRAAGWGRSGEWSHSSAKEYALELLRVAEGLPSRLRLHLTRARSGC